MSGRGRSQRTPTHQQRDVDDGAYAKALQEEYQKEFLRRRGADNGGGSKGGSKSKSGSKGGSRSKSGSRADGGEEGSKKKKKKKHTKSSGRREEGEDDKEGRARSIERSISRQEQEERKRRRRRNGRPPASPASTYGEGEGGRRSRSQRHSKSRSQSHGRSHRSRSHSRGSSVDSFNSSVSRTSSRQQQQIGNGAATPITVSVGEDWLSTHYKNDTQQRPTIVPIPAPYVNNNSSSPSRSSPSRQSSHHQPTNKRSTSSSSARHSSSRSRSSPRRSASSHHGMHSSRSSPRRSASHHPSTANRSDDSPHHPHHTSNRSDDEAYARQIQAQLEQEEAEQSRRDEEYARSISASGTPPKRAKQPQSRSCTRSNYDPRAPRHPEEIPIPIPPPVVLGTYVDVNAPPPIHSPPPKYTDVNATEFLDTDRYSTASGSTAPSTDIDDEAVARRIQQELHDAEFAQRVSLQEQQNMASEEAILANAHRLLAQQETVATTNQRTRPPRSCVAKYVPVCVCLSLAIALPLLFIFDVFSTDDIPFFGDLFGDDWIGNDPWSGNNNVTIELINGTKVPEVPMNAYRWANDGNGLRLNILNAVSQDYQTFVETAIANWDSGTPVDSLTLFSTRIAYEKECSTVQGKLKICNGDYGDTRWRGLNEVLLSPRQNTIVASTAKLNDYYLLYEDDYQKIYTACHELGHGFGLPHWDEDFFNQDLGNCMDYTQNPQLSYKPDVSNFLYLAQLYGGHEVLGGEITTAALSEEYNDNNDIEMNINDDEPDQKQKKDKDDKQRTRQRSRTRTLRHNHRSNHRGLSSSLSLSSQQQEQQQPQQQHDSNIPLSRSRLLNEDGLIPGIDDVDSGVVDSDNSSFFSLLRQTRKKRRTQRTRILLEVEDTHEIHMYESEEYPGHIVLQRFELVVPQQ